MSRLIVLGLLISACLSLALGASASHSERQMVSLNGYWDFYPDGGETAHKILTPSFWDAPQDYDYPQDWLHRRHGVYRRDFTIPASMANKRVFLELGGVSVIAKLFVNGVPVGGEDAKGYLMMMLPYRIDITPHIRWKGSNRIEVQAWGGKSIVHGEDSQDNLIEDDDFPPDTKIDGRFLFPYCVDHWDGRRGITGDVSLVALSKVHVEDVYVIPNLHKNGDPEDDEVSVRLTLANRDQRSRKVRVENRAVPVGDGDVKNFEPVTVTLPANSTMQVTLDDVSWPDAAYWWPHDARLYALETVLSESGETVDKTLTRFGVREFYVKGDHYELNGVRANLRGDAYEFSWHEGYRHGPSTAPVFSTKELIPQLQRELLGEYAALNHNMLRPHKASAWAGLYDQCDETGMMVFDEAPFWETWVRTDERSKPYYEAWVRRWVKARRNHPSIVAWIGANECWYGATGVISVQAIRTMDTSRPSFHEDPWGPVQPDDSDEPFEGDEDCRHYSGGYPYKALNTKDLYGVYRRNPNKPSGEGESLFPEGFPLMNADGTLSGKASERGEFGHPDMVSQGTWLRAVCRMVRAMRYAGLSDSRLYANWMYAFDPIEADIALEWEDLAAPGIKPALLRRPILNVFDDRLPRLRPSRGYDYYRASFAPVAVFDKECDRHDRIGEQPITFEGGESTTRLLAIYNDEFASGEEITVTWAAVSRDPHKGANESLASGEFKIAVPYGEKRERQVRFVLPAEASAGRWLDLSVSASKSGKPCFKATNRLGVIMDPPDPKLTVVPHTRDLTHATRGHWHTVRLVNVGGGASEDWSITKKHPALKFRHSSGNLRREQDLHFQIDPTALPQGESSIAIEFSGAGGSTDCLEVRCRR